jgi:predicted DNA-binding transcriptional regulator YafY
MARSQRLLDLIQVLRRCRRPVAGATLANEVSVSLRTLYRDIETLKAQGCPHRRRRRCWLCAAPWLHAATADVQ